MFAYIRAARVTQQAAWTDGPTNLTRAFTALAEIGILTRENFSCCGSCAARDIWDELDDTRNSRGYIDFHKQDTEDLVVGQSTYVGYGVFVPAHVAEQDWTALSDTSSNGCTRS